MEEENGKKSPSVTAKVLWTLGILLTILSASALIVVTFCGVKAEGEINTANIVKLEEKDKYLETVLQSTLIDNANIRGDLRNLNDKMTRVEAQQTQFNSKQDTMAANIQKLLIRNNCE